MGFLDLIGYDRHGAVTEVATTLNKGRLNTYGVTLAALGFNAPAWVAASSMSVLYAMVGHAAPLAIVVAYFFPMLILAFCLVYLVREAPSAAGVFTYVERFLHPGMGTVLGWTYTVMAATVAPMTAVIGAEYIQALFPSLAGDIQARIIGTAMLLLFFLISLRGIVLTAKIAGLFLVFEITVVSGLGLCGIFDPQVHNLSFASLYSVKAAGGWGSLGAGLLFGLWMLANFDSAINYIEEAKVPVRTVQRSLLLVLSLAFLIYSLAAIGWQYAVPVGKLAQIVEDGNSGPIAAIANIYLPQSLSWIALFVVVTSACAGMQISLNSGARTMYRMSSEGHLPEMFGKTNKHKAPFVSVASIVAFGILMVWIKPLAKIIFYYDAVTITLVLSYASMLAAAIRLFWMKHSAGVATMLSILPVFSIFIILYVGYSAGISPGNLYEAWYIGAAVIVIGTILAFMKKRNLRYKNRVVMGAADD
ncbi:MAG: APC family permease [Candidatus Pacebacteria bacterium]|uniref:APC family permease n=1 Tax=Acidithiobacillus ferridurans TaxID=1232575 RepID=UPI001C07BAF2|nr:APC family permease [Acidithiobacillus ferridurans]MBU2732652.1 APC family permease [Acidithiobacillus ferridurans]MDD5318801.1 APC family permease [Candidatus Paceibacterota bacterium]